MGVRYDVESRSFKYSEKNRQEDKMMKDKGETDNQRMARVCLPCMNSINPDL